MTAAEVVVVITVVVVVGALCLSIYKLYLVRRDKRSLLRSAISFGFPVYQTRGSKLNDFFFCLEVTNPSEKSAKVSQVEILVGQEKLILVHYLGKKLPFKLSSGHSESLVVPVIELASILSAEGYTGEVGIRANFKDAAGRNCQSKKINIDVDKWLEQQKKPAGE